MSNPKPPGAWEAPGSTIVAADCKSAHKLTTVPDSPNLPTPPLNEGNSSKMTALPPPQASRVATTLPRESAPVLEPRTGCIILACAVAYPEQFAPYRENLTLLCGSGKLPLALSFEIKKRPGDPLDAYIQRTRHRVTRGDSSFDEEGWNEFVTTVRRVKPEEHLRWVLDWIEEWIRKAEAKQALQDYAIAVEACDKQPSEKAVTTLRHAQARLKMTFDLIAEPGHGFYPADAADLIAAEQEQSIPVLDGMLDRGDLLIAAASSKSKKTWCALHAAIMVATGGKWWNWHSRKGTVVFVNFELKPHTLQERLKSVASNVGVPIPRGAIQFLNLRGHPVEPDALITRLIRDYRDKDVSLFILDPLYVLLGGKVENSAEDMVQVMNMLGRLAAETKAAVWVTHHFSKGNQAAKDAIDRLSGSGVFGRYADSLLTMTPLKTADAFRVDLTTRAHPPMKSFAIRWEFPLMRVDPFLDPDDLKQPPSKTEKYSDSEVLKLVAQPRSFGELKEAASSELGMSKSTLCRRIKELKISGKLTAQDGKYVRVGAELDL